MVLVLLLPLALLLIGLFVASVAWVWQDANRRGQPGFIVAVLVAFLCWPFSLIVWLLARPESGGAPAKSRSGCLVAAIVLAGILFVLPVALMFLFFTRRAVSVSSARQNAHRVTCMNNERQLALAYELFVDKHGRCPQTFADLREFGITDNTLHCPAALEVEPPGSYSYELLPGTNATDVIIRENRSNHHGEGGCVAYRGGHVEWNSNKR